MEIGELFLFFFFARLGGFLVGLGRLIRLVGLIGFGRFWRRSRRFVYSAIDPNFADFGFGIEIAGAFDHGEVGHFADFDGSKAITHSAQSRRHSRQRRQCIRFRKAAIQRQLKICAEPFFIAQAVSREGDFHALLSEQGSVFGGPIPVAELVEADLVPIVLVREFGQRGKIQRHDEGCRSGFDQLGPAPFLAAGDQAKI